MVTVNSLEQPPYLEKACIQGGFRRIVSSCVFSSEWIPCIWGTGFGIKESRSVESSHLNVSGSFSLCPVGITGVRNGLDLWAELWTVVSPPCSNPSLPPFPPTRFPSSPSPPPRILLSWPGGKGQLLQVTCVYFLWPWLPLSRWLCLLLEEVIKGGVAKEATSLKMEPWEDI